MKPGKEPHAAQAVSSVENIVDVDCGEVRELEQEQGLR